MKSNYDKLLRDSFSEKIEVPEEYQQKIKESLKQVRIDSPQKMQDSMDKCFQTDNSLENFFQRHKISFRICLSLSCGICVCLGLIMLLSIFLKQGNLRKDFDNMQKQHARISATPAKTETTAASDNTLRTEIPADTESPQKTNSPIDTRNPALTTNNTHIPRNTQKNDTEATQTKTPETHMPLLTGTPIASTAPDLEIVFPSAAETPVRASATPTT